MAVSLIGVPAAASTDAVQSNTINQEEFMRVLLTQLRFQDPMKPLDNQEFLAQMAQFSSLEQTRQLSEHISNLLTVQSASQSIGLIGKTVEVRTSTGSSVGEVTTITFREGVPFLTVQIPGGTLTDVSLGQIVVVREGT
jgi:flagellar basal-body rod modification protein FlgD